VPSTGERAHEVRIAIAPRAGERIGAVRRDVERVLGDGWEVRRPVRGATYDIATTTTHAVVGTPEHARISHEAALALHRSGRFEAVEADVPVPGFADPADVAAPDADAPGDVVGAFSGDECDGDSAALDWTHRLLRWPEAMALMTSATRGGAGISIGHPDSGYTLHPNLGASALDLARDRDVISGDDDARDDLRPNPLWPLPNPGHGTSTASVIVGRGTPAAGIVGLAPKAMLVPIRATESVVQLFDSDVATAVAHARTHGCQIVSMSLGGKGFFGLKSQIQRAVDAGMIVMAAAGNRVGIVTAPASYANCIAVAATGPGDDMWSGSSRGPAVDVSMPGACVHNASHRGTQPTVTRSHGTSYAVAHLAGAAALWLAHHGHARLVAAYGARRVQAAFLAALRWPGVCVTTPDWDDDWGLGRVDLVALLQAPLPARNELDAVRAFGSADGPAERLAATVGARPTAVRTRLAALLHATDQGDLADLLAAHEGELVYLAMADPAFAIALSEPGAAGAFGPLVTVDGLSDELASRIST
jgi:hypothetical protein